MYRESGAGWASGMTGALGEIEAGAGRAFDPEVVRDLIPLRPRLERLLALEAAHPA